MQYLHKSKLKSEIFNERKSLLTKIFSSVNSDSEFSYFLKDGMGIKDKKLVYYGVSLKIWFLGLVHKNRGDFLKKEGLDSLQI